MAEKMPSSVKLGVRPMRERMRAYSSGFRPCAAARSGVTFGSGVAGKGPPDRAAMPSVWMIDLGPALL